MPDITEKVLGRKFDMEQHRCDDCGRHFGVGDLKEIKDLEQRITPGYAVPSGECPLDGALCYPITGDSLSARVSEVALALQDLGINIMKASHSDEAMRSHGWKLRQLAARLEGAPMDEVGQGMP